MIDHPRVLINCDHAIDKDAWYRSNYNIPVSYCEMFAKNNVLIISGIPAGYNLQCLKTLVSISDGYLFIGGGDYPSDFMGYEKTEHEHPMTLERARNDMLIFREAWNLGKPILGICDGIQLASLALGGKIIPNLPSDKVVHKAKSRHEDSMHSVKLTPGRLSSILGAEEFMVNSSHHQAVDPDGVPDGLQVVGRAEDGTIEAMERKRKGFGLFTQWHPERHPDVRHRNLVFMAFIKALKQSFNLRTQNNRNTSRFNKYSDQ